MAEEDQNNRNFSVRPSNQESPQATLSKMVQSIFDSDYERFDECIYQGPLATRAIYGCFNKSTELKTALTEHYGPEAWARFNQERVQGVRTSLELTQLDQESVLAALEKGLHFEVHGDVATCILPWSNGKQAFRRGPNGAWYVDLGGETEQVAVFWSSFVTGIDAATAQIPTGVPLTEIKVAFEEARSTHLRKAAAKSK